jgi:hypothetical protein
MLRTLRNALLAAALILPLAAAAQSGDSVSGTVQSVNPVTGAIVVDGVAYSVAPEVFDLGGLKRGTAVFVRYEVAGGQRRAVAVSAMEVGVLVPSTVPE